MYLTIDINRIIHRFLQRVMISFDPTMVQRNIYTILKTKVRGEERLQNMENAFVNSQSLKELEIGIIDNVLTTGVANCLRRNF